MAEHALERARRVEFNETLEAYGWAALLITVGIIWMLPEGQVPRGCWLIAAGVILLGMNAVRYLNGIEMSGFGLVVGIVAMTLGVAGHFNVSLPLVPIVLIAIGVCMLVGRWVRARCAGGCCRVAE